MPKVLVIEDSAPNAFATGRNPSAAHVAATRGLLDKLEKRELEAVMAHELSHLRLSHLSNPYRDRRGAWEQEFDADAAGMALVTGRKSGGQRSWALDVWACDLALTALHFLDLTLGVMAYGHRDLAWVSETHPDALSRRKRLRELALVSTKDVPDVARAAAGGLWRMSDALFGRLWEIVGPMLTVLRETRNARPSPLWRERIASIFATR